MKLVTEGEFYYPASRRYSTGVMCDKCRDLEITCCIGCHSYDICLPCCYNLILHDRGLPQPSPEDIDINPDIVIDPDRLTTATFRYPSCVICPRCNQVAYGHLEFGSDNLCLMCCIDVVGRYLSPLRKCKVCNFTGRYYIAEDEVCDFCKVPPVHMVYGESGSVRRSLRDPPVDELTIVKREIAEPCSYHMFGLTHLANSDFITTITLLSSGGIRFELYSGIRSTPRPTGPDPLVPRWEN